ncbi:Cof-type HAD-IIB family hydrolase [Vibrio sp. JC009]|uniref:Cof-type HAD-IIB family hydrolase n=1 Tax=Vibrio sp. JC009 TaxID=2912314 RepID=UPI0023B16D8D|nr:Cof-type HAD-IIB family hydrolase [Vibrio sp. JC009]WED21763.1 Cof-type HAD-IIB family hydrolase [Vibrio sp. JC009]
MTAVSDSKFKIVASDLDGTLLAPNHQLNDFAKQTLSDLHEKGLTFIFATGRHHVDVSGIREQAGIPAFMITSNGARVHDQENNLLYSKNVESHIVQPIIDIVKKDPEIRINVYQDDKWFISREDEFIKKFHKDSGFAYSVFDTDSSPTDGIAKIFFVYPDHEHLVKFEEEINQSFGDLVNAAFSTPFCLEVMAAEVSKGGALKAVAESMDLALDDCIAFGDGMNDVEMLSMAGKGLVMGSAHQKVFNALPDNEVIGTNEHDAVAHYLRDNLF